MRNYSDKYIYKLVDFDYFGSSFFALCVGLDDEGKLVCYRARQKTKPKFSSEVILEDSQGNSLGFVIEYTCKFRIHPGCVRKCILVCEEEFASKIDRMHSSLPSLKSLVEEYKTLKFQYYHTPIKESKTIRNKMGELSHQIDARQAIFLQEAKLKKARIQESKYRNFRQVPNKKGITHVYTGGSCSGK